MLTICTFQCRHLFGVVRRDGNVARIELTVLGEIARQEWLRGAVSSLATVDAFIVMPNHVHGIVRLGLAPLGEFVGRVKSAVTSRARHETDDTIVRMWQRGYHDRILRDVTELAAARTYIANNPMRWIVTA